MCTTGKIEYEDSSRASAALINCIKKERDEKRYYLCPNCNHYHLTSLVSFEEPEQFKGTVGGKVKWSKTTIRRNNGAIQ